MATIFTTTTALAAEVQTYYDQAVMFGFMPELYFDGFCEEKYSTSSTPQRGESVTFTKITDLTESTTPLNETTDVDGQAMGDSQVIITLYEYGDAVTLTEKLKVTAFTQTEANAMTAVGYVAGKSLDTVAATALTAGTNVAYGNNVAGRSSIVPASLLKAADVRKMSTYLSRSNVPTVGGYYVAVCHSNVIHDLREETGSGAWRTPKEYVDPSEIYNGEIGEFEGFRFVKSPRVPYILNSPSAVPTTLDIYKNLFFGAQAFGKAIGYGLKVGTSGPFDKLQRFQHVYWKALMGFGIVRQESVYRLETTSSLPMTA